MTIRAQHFLIVFFWPRRRISSVCPVFAWVVEKPSVPVTCMFFTTNARLYFNKVLLLIQFLSPSRTVGAFCRRKQGARLARWSFKRFVFVTRLCQKLARAQAGTQNAYQFHASDANYRVSNHLLMLDVEVVTRIRIVATVEGLNLFQGGVLVEMKYDRQEPESEEEEKRQN